MLFRFFFKKIKIRCSRKETGAPSFGFFGKIFGLWRNIGLRPFLSD